MHNFVELIEKHRNELYRYILRTVWDTSVADDVFSAAVLAAWENRAKFTPGTNFRAWLYRIVTNKCFVANRETKRTPVSLDDIPEHVFISLEEDHSYKDALEDPVAFLQACGDEVNMAIRKLSTAQRTCFLLRTVHKFSYQEIAEIMDMPFGTVMTHLSRGRAKLRKELLNYAQEQGIVRKPLRLLRRNQAENNAAEQADN